MMKTVGKGFVEVFSAHFQSSTVAPGDPYLNYREVGYWPGLCMVNVPCKVIVVRT
jgi:hypothetical protein